jgi:hypothetical protein
MTEIIDAQWAAILADTRKRRFVLVIPHDARAQPRLEPKRYTPEPRWRGLKAMGDDVLARTLQENAA